jgi:hypothetical protein
VTQPQHRPDRIPKWPFAVAAGLLLLLVIITAANSPAGNPAPAAAQQTPVAVAPTADPSPAAAESTAPVAAAPQPVAPAAPAAPAVDPDSVTYEVTGDGVAKAGNITYVKDENFSQQQANDVALPWTATVEIPDNGVFRPLSIVAQSGSGRNGTITCRILDAAGAEITSSTSSGPYAVVTCAG